MQLGPKPMPQHLQIAASASLRARSQTIYDNESNIIANPACPRDVDIPSTISGQPVTSIGNGAFANKSLVSVTIPNSVVSIGSSSFGQNLLSSITIPNSVTSLGVEAFSEMPSLTTATIGSGVLTIEDNMFFGSGLTSVAMLGAVTSIGNSAFYANSLTSISLPSTLVSIGQTAFFGNRLSSLSIPNSVTRIGSLSFAANDLSSLAIGSGLSSIPSYAFMINSFEEVLIPDTITSLTDDAFGFQVSDARAFREAVVANDTPAIAAQYTTRHYVRLMTSSPSNPQGLTDGLAQEDESAWGIDFNGDGDTADSSLNLGGHIVNPVTAAFEFKDSSGLVLQPTDTMTGKLPSGVMLKTYRVSDGPTVINVASPTELTAYFRAGATLTYNGPVLAGITPLPASHTFVLGVSAANIRPFTYSTSTGAPATETPAPSQLANTGTPALKFSVLAAAIIILAGGIALRNKHLHYVLRRSA
ncbi:leucine-rich repeat domain-containing protein [Candidatus Saccharibacteria bacterium]|nr:leucine-rich repeat domain-containing protein [Candidatus Saccharibacteria bacterium]